ncbi:hypothetical protein [Bradyrhizobium elkanii]|uniref:hypothetical protein n=1 Tax=Bradyrhizobium elkanii TaxID=29448 RepID=UPI00272BC8A7|nr:hypothetical protein [Bradyrhizobium elkanii]WLA80351.1 hypothetical protein QNJ99_33945 [Bradyrhizobium elkanii]
MSNSFTLVRLPTDVASADVNTSPRTSGDSADAINTNPAFPSRVSATAAASPVIRGAAAFSSNPDRGHMGRRLHPALGTSVVSCGEAIGTEALRKEPSMASRLTPPRPQDSFSHISAIHRSHRVLRHAVTASHFSHDGDSRKRHGADSESTDYNEIQHFRHSVLMVGVNTA